jgi:hypothetical protein
VTVKLKVAAESADLLAVQNNQAGYAVNRTNGSVLRVDAATWDKTDAVTLLPGTTGA